ncbi:hypothetical protein ABB37_02624 [Leptomonas pyrrhocoris]|uniref:Uncharacterized protein n=1 Tax=Leptomonas pyrrhocoris TaxID=157538 RepID=A0A0N0DXE3_LEPPY|nr:hypothetical protein ABB37_02624 [Leptomonas pyrrhocoris]KPA82852.1 hypothetical protein ABB37_02624 [Leptomonas pyrrhocoris]|eukprot:XP_015661291.1 hypothetical protein ABB37_02624 [Leptomonas pyrrhocoris]
MHSVIMIYVNQCFPAVAVITPKSFTDCLFFSASPPLRLSERGTNTRKKMMRPTY